MLSIIKEKPATLNFSNKVSEKLGNAEIDEEKYTQLIRKQENFSSNNLKIQNINNTNQNYLIGNGALGDRHLINQSVKFVLLFCMVESVVFIFYY